MAAPRRRDRTVRSRFTILYAALFLVSAIALLALTNLLAGANMTEPAPGQVPSAQQSGLAIAHEHIRQLETQLADAQAAQSRQLLMGSLIALVAMAVVSVALGNAVAGRVLRPLRTLTAATRRISAENLHERLAVPGPADEVKDLADTIDGLLGRLEASFTAQRRFVANASHELRTPLATMRASLDVAVAKPQPPPQTVALANRLGTELDRINSLLEGLLVLARAQHSALTERAPIALDTLTSAALTTRAAAIADKKLTLEAGHRHDATWIRGNPALLSRMVENLIDNAIVHNQDSGLLRVATTVEHTTAQLTVETSGPILDQGQVDRLAQPFQRLVADRTGSETGSGLGLSIVAAIAEAHGGRLDLHARPDGGLRVTVSLPTAAAPHEATT